MRKLPRYNHKRRKNNLSYSNNILAKSISSNLISDKKTFFNVNFRGVRLRKCKFTECKFILCDLYGAILNKGKFENVLFKKCVFYASVFKKCKFIGCTFEECVFINNSSGFFQDSNIINCREYSYYDLCVPTESQLDFVTYRSNKLFQKNRLLHIKGGKVNKATVFIAMSFFTYEDFKRRLEVVFENDNTKSVFTTFKLIEVLQKIR